MGQVAGTGLKQATDSVIAVSPARPPRPPDKSGYIQQTGEGLAGSKGGGWLGSQVLTLLQPAPLCERENIFAKYFTVAQVTNKQKTIDCQNFIFFYINLDYFYFLKY